MARRPAGTEIDALIGQYQHLTDYPRPDDALHAIRKIGSMVKPIMRQRGWKVGTLAEFYPDQRNLLGLNINAGQKIQVRLRYPNDRTQFLPFEDVLDTMLHELCHNVVGPHNAQFNALWDQLRDEMQSLMRKGYTGEGFLSQGHQLGGRRLPLHEASRLARQAAEERRKAAERARGSGQRLGGSGVRPGQDARTVIADAVERRLRIERGCASGTVVGDKLADGQGGKLTTTQAEPVDADEDTMIQAYIDLIQEEERQRLGGYYNPPSAENPAGPRGFDPPAGFADTDTKAESLIEQQRRIEDELAQQQKGSRRPADESHHTKPIVTNNAKAEKEKPSLDTWTCEICTLINPIAYLSCDACGVERPASIIDDLSMMDREPQTANLNTQRRETPNALKPRSSAYESARRFTAEREEKVKKGPLGWVCQNCGNFMEAEWWTCASCGRMKASS